MDREDMPYYKVDSHDKLVDMRSLSKDHLKSLLSFYQGRLKRARSEDMKKANSQCVQQISEYIYEGKVTGPVDIFTLCRQMGNTDVRSFIKTYFGQVRTPEELGRDRFISYFRNRKTVYPGAAIPTDAIVSEMFNAVVRTKPPALEKAASLFTAYYQIGAVAVKLSSLDYLTLYDMEQEIIMMNPGRSVDCETGTATTCQTI